jgi:hypothetical protein
MRQGRPGIVLYCSAGVIVASAVRKVVKATDLGKEEPNIHLQTMIARESSDK